MLKSFEDLRAQFPDLNFRFGGIFYRNIDFEEDKHEIFDLTDDFIILKNNFSNIKAKGGGDSPGDWVGAYSKVLNFNWRDGTKLIILTDAAHTQEFCGKENHEEENGKLLNIFESVAGKDINIFSFIIESKAKITFEVCENYYKNIKNFIKFFLLILTLDNLAIFSANNFFILSLKPIIKDLYSVKSSNPNLFIKENVI